MYLATNEDEIKLHLQNFKDVEHKIEYLLGIQESNYDSDYEIATAEELN